MPLPEESVLQQGDILARQREPGFVTENLPSPGNTGFELPDKTVAPIPIPGTGDVVNGSKKTSALDALTADVLGTKDSLTPGKLPRYSASDVYNPRYTSILPGENTEEAFALAQPWQKKWGNALTKMTATAFGTFVNGMTSIPDTIASINGGTPYDTASGNAIDRWLKNLENEFPNYYTKWEQEHPFMSALPFSGGFSNFWGDKFIKNLGFTVGAIGSAVATDWLVSTATAGVGTAPLIGQQVGKAALWLNKIFSGTDRAADLAALGRAAGRTGDQLVHLQTLARAAAAKKVMDGTRYAITLYGSTAAEAGFEARDGYNTVREDLLQAFQRENGYSATGEELENIESYARAAGNVRFGMNLAILGISNAIQFETILKPWLSARSAYRTGLNKQLETGATINVTREGVEQVIPKGIGKVWSKVKPVSASVLREGVFEEGGQYAAQIGSENYWERKYLFDKGLSTKQYEKDETPWNAQDQLANIIHSVVEGLGAEFGTDEGLENILLGSLTGAIMTGGSSYINRGRNARETQAVISLLNNKGVTDFIKNSYDTAATSIRISEDMKLAVENNDLFKYKNFQWEQFVEFIQSGLKAGRFDVRMEQLEMLKEMSNEDFQRAFGIDPTVENFSTVSEYVDGLKRKAEQVKKSYDLINRSFNNPFSFNRKATTATQEEENEKYQVFERWKEDLNKLASIAYDVDSRVESINREVRDINAAISLDYLTNLTDRNYLATLRDEMRQEAKALTDGIAENSSFNVPGDRKRISTLNARADLINNALTDPTLSVKRTEALFMNLLNYLANGQTDNTNIAIPQEAIGQLMEYGKDLRRLQTYKEDAYEAFDKLSTEEGFEKYFKDYKGVQRDFNQAAQAAQAAANPPVQITAPTTVTVTSGNRKKDFDVNTDYPIEINGVEEVVKIIGQTPDGVTVQKADGTLELVPAQNFFKDESNTENVNQVVDEVVTDPQNNPPPTTTPETKRGESKKDLSFGLYSTIDPPYDVRTTNDDNFQRRHQNFLFYLGSSDPKVFNQDNKPRLRIVPVTINTQEEFGFPANWIQSTSPSNKLRLKDVVVTLPANAQGGQVTVTVKGQPISFKNFALTIDGNDAYVSNIEIADKTTNKGVGTLAYIQLGLALRSRGITLSSTDTLKEGGRRVWERLAKYGYARKNQNGNYEFINDPTLEGFQYANFGLPSAQDIENDPIRAVYVIDDTLNEVEREDARNAIGKAVQRDGGISDIIKGMFKADLEGAINNFYDQIAHAQSRTAIPGEIGMSARSTLDEMELSLGEDIVNMIIEYKSAGVFFTDENGEKGARVGTKVDPTTIIYSNFATTNLLFGNEDRYTNKENLDPAKMTKWWASERAKLLSVTAMKDTKMFQFEVSRGFPNVKNNESRNSVVEVGLVREQDFDKPILTVSTQGNTAVLGAFNEEGEGIGSAKTGVNMPLGYTLLNYGTNLLFMNNRRLTADEASNIFDLLKVFGKDATQRVPILRYLNKIVYFANRKKNIAPTKNSLTIDGNFLLLGEEKTPILMRDSTLDANRDRILTFLTGTFHNVNNSELLRIAKNPKATDLEFVELRVQDDKVVQGAKYKNYNYYLLSTKTSEGKQRGEPPLTTNIAVPQENEIPITDKYSVLKGLDYESDKMAYSTPQPQPAPTPAPTPVVETPVVETGPTQSQIDAVRRKREEIDKKKKIIQQGITPGEIPELPTLEFVEVGGVRLAYTNPTIDENGNVTDIVPAGKLLDDGTLVPFKDPIAIKEVILQTLRQNQPTQDNTVAPEQTDEFDEFDDPNISLGDDAQTRLFFGVNGNYQRGNLTEEFAEFRRIIPDEVVIRDVDHLLKTTSGGLAWGAFQDSAVYIYENAEVGTTYHEAFEVIWGLYLTGREQQNLYDEFIERKGDFTTYLGKNKPFSEASMKEMKEQLAEEFRDYKLSNKLPTYKRQRNFFQRLLDFIRKIIYGDQSRVNSLFKKMNKGYYRNYSTSVRSPLDAEYRLIGDIDFNETTIQDIMQGMASDMFSELFKDSADIVIQLEENPDLAAKDIYNNLKRRFDFFFEDRTANNVVTLRTIFGTKLQQLDNQADRQTLIDQVKSIRAEWQKIRSNWEAFVREHQRYLRVFNIEFEVDDEGNISVADAGDMSRVDEEKSQTQYDRDIFQVDAKNNSSAKIKLLFATIADSVWAREATEAAIGAARGIKVETKRDDSVLALPKLAPYAKLFNYVLHNTNNIGNIYDIWGTLRRMIANPDQRKAIDANVQRIMNRVDFNNGFENKTTPQVKIILALENTLAKQKPAFFRQFVDFQGNTYFTGTPVNSKTDQLKEMWLSNMRASDAVRVEGEGFVFSPSIIGISDPIKFLNKIGIKIDKSEYARLQGSAVTKFNNAVNKVRSVIEKAAKEKTVIPIVSSKQLDVDSRLNELAEIYTANISGDDTQSQHNNLDNEPTSNFVLNNAVSNVLNDANNASDREDFINRLDNGYFRDIFHQDSILLNNIIYGEDGKFRKIVELGVVEGRESWDQNNKPTSSLTEAERQLYEINNNLNGVFYTLLPADAKTEWAINSGTYYSANNYFGDDTSRSNEFSKFSRQMYRWLETEVALAIDYPNRKDISSLNRKLGDRKAGNSLRFFGDILPKELVDRIHKEVIDEGKALSSILEVNDLRPYMVDFIEKKVNETFANLNSWRIIDSAKKEDYYTLYGFDRSFLDTNLGKKRDFTEREVKRLLSFREINYVTNNIEMHKFFFGDPAQYKDELKRIKSFLSGRENMHIDILETSQGFNQWANANLNRTEPNGVELLPTDPGYQQFKNHANTLTILDVEFESSAMDDIREAIGDDTAEAYGQGNEDDAGAYMTGSAYREVIYRSGGRFTAAQEKQFQWEMAWERNDKAKQGKYTYSSKALERADNELLKEEPNTEVAYPILKLMHSGVRDVNGMAVASLHKASWAPLFYRWHKGNNLGELYNLMQKKGIDYVEMESANKVGMQGSSTLRLYNEVGNINTEGFETAVAQAIPFKQFGIQVEQAKKDKGQTEGSQLRKIAISDLKDNDVPIDFSKEYKDKGAAFNAWNELTEEQKEQKSPIYQKIKRHDEAIKNLVNARTEATMNRLGIKLTEDGAPYIPDKKRISDFILSELERRELPRNIAQGIEIDPRTQDFSQPLEANAQYSKIRSIIYSIVEKTIMRPKVNGGQKTLLAATGFESGTRLVKKRVNGKPVYTSSNLKFYKVGKNGTEACEVMLPYWFGKLLTEAGSGRTKEEVIKYLNTTQEGKELLRGIGFRIPTQGLNSLDFFVIKDFLPEQMGDVVVLPSEITVKAGSDFDIDKLNVYLRNAYIDAKTGFPKLVRYQGSEQATKEYILKLIDEGIINSEQAQGQFERWISDETDGVQETDVEVKILGAAELFSRERLAEDFLKENRVQIVELYYQKALENEYFDSIESLISLPENFGRLVTPNDASYLKGLRAKLRDLKGEQGEELGNYGKLLSSNFMMKERHAYMSSKQVVGISAVSQTAHVIAQNIPGGLQVTDSSISIRAAHNSINGKISLSGLTVAEGDRYISNVNSQTTDGGVDVAKDKFLAEMGINQDTLGTFLTIVRAGVDPWWTVLYLNQPAIQEFLKLKAIHSSVSQINRTVKQEPDFNLLEEIYKQFGGVGKNRERLDNKPSRYSLASMQEMIEKFYKDKKDLTNNEKTLQLMILDDYLRWNKGAKKYQGLSSLAWDVFHLYQGYNWDTARLNDPNEFRLKLLKYEKANNLSISPARLVIENTFVGTMKERAEQLDTALRSLINVQSGEADEILWKLAIDLNTQGRMDGYTKKQLMLAAELAMVDYAVQTGGEIAGRSINSYIHPLILGDRATARYVLALQNHNDKRISNNPFLKNLIVKLDNRVGFPSFIELAEKDYETYTSNLWTDAMRELRDDTATIISINENEADDRSVSQIYNNLVLTMILQNGSKKSRTAGTHLIPNETYSGFTVSSLRNMNLQGFYENLVFYRTNALSSTLIPNVELEYDDQGFIFGDEDTGRLPEVGEGTFLKALREVMNVERAPAILNVTGWKYRKNKVIKYVQTFRDEQTRQIISQNVRLFARVDVLSPGWFKAYADRESMIHTLETEPLSYMKGKIVFKEINPWGDGTRIQEYYQDNVQSILPNNSKVVEATDDQVLYALHRAGGKTNADELYLSIVIQRIEGDDPGDNDFEGNEPPIAPDDSPIVPLIPQNMGTLQMQPDNIEKIKSGVKTITNRTEKIADGIYTLPDGTTVNIELLGQGNVFSVKNSKGEIQEKGVHIRLGSSAEDWDADSFARAEGFTSWTDFEQNNKFSKNFVNGSQLRFIYRVTPMQTGAMVSSTNPNQLSLFPNENESIQNKINDCLG